MEWVTRVLVAAIGCSASALVFLIPTPTSGRLTTRLSTRVPVLFAAMFRPGVRSYSYIREILPTAVSNTDRKTETVKRRATCRITRVTCTGKACVSQMKCRLSATIWREREDPGVKARKTYNPGLGAATFIANDRGLWLAPLKCSASCRRRLLSKKPTLPARPRAYRKGNIQSGQKTAAVKSVKVKVGTRAVTAWCYTEAQRTCTECVDSSAYCFAPNLGLVRLRKRNGYGTRHPFYENVTYRMVLIP